MKISDIHNMKLITEFGDFYPIYTYDYLENDEYVNFVLIKTAEEVYKKFLDDNGSSTEITLSLKQEVELLKEENKILKEQLTSIIIEQL